ncbi:MAG: sulfurtransferase-like selenium metabolism protein YedF [Thermodesulfobacteriota bacterium]
MIKELDCRGLACPQPVLAVKEALEGMPSGVIKVLVDNQPAVGNVTRFALAQGCRVESAPEGEYFGLTITKDAPGAGGEAPTCGVFPAGRPRVVVQVAGRFMGRGDDELGRVLMRAFLKSLKEATLRPEALVFYNSGVQLTVAGSEYLEDLRALEALGVRVLSCGTCLDFYRMKDALAVGQVTNMFEIIETLSRADRVVSP